MVNENGFVFKRYKILSSFFGSYFNPKLFFVWLGDKLLFENKIAISSVRDRF